MDTIKVLIADDQRLVREGIASLLNLQGDIEVVGTAVDGDEAIKLAKQEKPNIILMDVRMPRTDGIAAARAILGSQPDIHIIMLTTFDDEEYIVKSLHAGARGYLLKDMPADDLAQAVRLTASGITPFAPNVADKLLPYLQGFPGKGAPLREKEGVVHPLTERELDVLRLIATGATNKEIAAELVLSEGTVKNHVSSILSRLGLRDRIQAALYAYEHDLI